MEEVNKFGKTSPFMKVIGGITRPMEGDGSFIPMETFMRENGKMIKPMVRVSITTTMGRVIMVNGSKMFNKVLVFRNGPMDHLMKGNFLSIFSQHHNGLKHGVGKFIWPDMSQYEGEFYENKIQGRGRMIWPDGK